MGETPYCFLSDGRLVATYKAEDGTRLIVGTPKHDEADDGGYDVVEFGRYVLYTKNNLIGRHYNAL